MDPLYLKNERALALLGEWGTGESTEPMGGKDGPGPYYAHTIDHAPEWSEWAHVDGAVTALGCAMTACKPVDGYAVAAIYNVGEAVCPWCDGLGERSGCGDGCGAEDCGRVPCELCEESGYLSAGYDLQVVMVPRHVVTENGRELEGGMYFAGLGDWKTGRDCLAAILWEAHDNEEHVEQRGTHAWWIDDGEDGNVYELMDRLDHDTGMLRDGAPYWVKGHVNHV